MSIGFLFLTLGDIHPVWKKWFPHYYNVYIHNKYNLREPEFAKKCIKTIITEWGHISIVKAMILLLKEAFKDTYITHFVFLSGNCVPLYDYIYTCDNICKLKTSTFDFFQEKVRVNNLDDTFFKLTLRHSQWCILNRYDAEFLINNDYTKHFNKVSIPDELYFGTILKFANCDIKNVKTTYVNWKKYVKRRNGRSPHQFKILDQKILSSVYLNHPSALFMRKVDHDVVIYPYKKIYKEIKACKGLKTNIHISKFD